MILGLLAVAFALLALPGMRTRPPERLPMNEWAPVATGALAVGAVALELALVLAALPTLAHAFGIHEGVLDACRDALAPLSTDPGLVTWSAAFLALFVAIRAMVGAARSLRVARRARIEPWIGEHHVHDDFELVVIPTAEFVALGVPGSNPQIVVSRGLVEQLEPEHLDAVILHEAAHHRLRHSRYLVLLSALDAALGRVRFVHRSVVNVRGALEVWADSDAGSQDRVTRSSLREALRSMLICNASADGGRRIRPRDRLRRLDREVSPRPAIVRLLSYAPVAILALTVGVLSVAWFTDAHHAVALGLPCAH